MLQTEALTYRYQFTDVLKDVGLSFEAGKLYTIIGKSGSGKTTLLSLLAGISQLQHGTITFEGKKLATASLKSYRREISIVFQSYNLINYLSPLQNVQIALDMQKKVKGNPPAHYLKMVGLYEEDHHRPCSQLSGGQQQRVAIARALAVDAKVIFADEPTGNLDSQTAEEIILLLKGLAAKGKCVICVTHDAHLEEYADEVIQLKDGVVQTS